MSEEGRAARAGAGDQADRADDLLGHSLEAVLADVGAPEHSLSSGSSAALAVALAAALVRATTKAIEQDAAQASGYAVQAENLRLRAVELVGRNRDHYAAARLALEQRRLDPGHHDHRIGATMKESVETLGAIAGAGSDVAGLAADVAEVVPAEVRPDAASAAALAEAGARIAVLLAEANLLSSALAEGVETAREELAAAVAASRRASELLGG